MKFLVKVTPTHVAPMPPGAIAEVLSAQRDWFKQNLEHGTLDCAYRFIGGGGVGIANADSIEEMHGAARPIAGLCHRRQRGSSPGRLQRDGGSQHRRLAAAYLVVAEALTNVAKHARANAVSVDLQCTNGTLVVTIPDDGVGGADPGRGSGLRGLVDRVQAVGGRLEVDSPPSEGTRLRAQLPTNVVGSLYASSPSAADRRFRKTPRLLVSMRLSTAASVRRLKRSTVAFARSASTS
jgi:hypothetical protein